MKLAVFAFAFACLGWSQQNNALVERIGTTGFLQLEAASFRDATPRQQALLTEPADPHTFVPSLFSEEKS